MPKILLVEDDIAVSGMVADGLQAQRHAVDVVGTIQHAQEHLQSFTYDLLILDWELPDGSGVELCTQYRKQRETTPILMLTGKSSINDKLQGLDSGADDYLTKPFSLIELTARVRALLRRLPNQTDESTSFADIALDRTSRKAAVGTNDLKLSPREFALLAFLISHTEDLLSQDHLRNKVWWDEPDVTRNTVNATVARLRKKLEDAGSRVSINAVIREGFKIEVEP